MTLTQYLQEKKYNYLNIVYKFHCGLTDTYLLVFIFWQYFSPYSLCILFKVIGLFCFQKLTMTTLVVFPVLSEFFSNTGWPLQVPFPWGSLLSGWDLQYRATLWASAIYPTVNHTCQHQAFLKRLALRMLYSAKLFSKGIIIGYQL